MGSIMDTLAFHTDAQISTAREGKTLAYRDAEKHPSIMVQAPSNNLGALFRASYWAAVAARIALAQGTDPTKLFTLAIARRRSATGAVALGNSSLGLMSAIGLVYSPGGTGDIDSILREVEELAARMGAEEVASTLWLQRQRGAQAATRDTSKPLMQLSIPFLGTGLTDINKNIRRAITVVTVVAVVGGLLWVARPILAPLGRAAGRAGTRAYERRRRRRRQAA